jgi:hypothetical protein
MILTKTVCIKIEGVNFKRYKSKGYIFNWRDIVEIKVEDLLPNSNVKILVKCDICGAEKEIGYNKYNKNILRGDFYSCQKCSPIKRKNTCMELFGVDNYTKSVNYIEKQKDFCIENYGVDSFFKTINFKNKKDETFMLKYGTTNIQTVVSVIEKTKNTCMEKYGVEKFGHLNRDFSVPQNLFKIYKQNCRNLTNKIKKELFNQWNGTDYYDGEYIKDNLSLHYNSEKYPTIDHKISIYNGFKNNIPENIICDIDNLCITKRKINSTKNKF